MFGPLAFMKAGLKVGLDLLRQGAMCRRQVSSHPSPIRALAIEGHPPRHPYKPGAEPISVAQLREASIGLGKRLLGDVLGVFPITENAVCDANRERGRLDQPDLEFTGQVRVHCQAVIPGVQSRSQLGAIMHVASPR